MQQWEAIGSFSYSGVDSVFITPYDLFRNATSVHSTRLFARVVFSEVLSNYVDTIILTVTFLRHYRRYNFGRERRYAFLVGVQSNGSSDGATLYLNSTQVTFIATRQEIV